MASHCDDPAKTLFTHPLCLYARLAKLLVDSQVIAAHTNVLVAE
jgi:hypothetical protein